MGLCGNRLLLLLVREPPGPLVEESSRLLAKEVLPVLPANAPLGPLLEEPLARPLADELPRLLAKELLGVLLVNKPLC